MKLDVTNPPVDRARASLVLLLIPFILSSCITMGSYRKPSGSKEKPREKVTSETPSRVEVSDTERRGKSVKEVASSAEVRRGGERKREPVARQYGEVAADSVNIRAGANMNYEILGKLSKGDKVSIVSSAFGWHEIELPLSCFGWIHSDYVSVQNVPSAGEEVTGVVTGNSVRIRARPGLRYSVLSQVNKGDKLVVVGLEGDWLKIRPPRECAGWVSSEYIRILP